MKKPLRQAVRLPKGWKTRVRSAVLEVISLAKYSLTTARGWSSEKQGASGHWKAECERLQNDLVLTLEELLACY